MYRFIAERFAALVATMAAVSVLIFLMVRLLPGSILDLFFAGDTTATPAQIESAKHQLGIYGSYPDQYWRWISGAIHGDFGHSFLTQQPVSSIMATSIPIDLELILLAIVIALLIGIPLGALSAVRRDSAIDYLSRVTGLVGISIPNFWLATLLLIFTSRLFHWVPPLAYVSFFSHPIQNLEEFVLPAIAISVFTLAIVSRMVRATMLEVLNLDYVRTARAKGASRRVVLVKHALRNALVPVVTVTGFEIGALISGAAIAERIFGLPGVGAQLLNGIFSRDYPVVEASTLIIAATFVVANFFVDILYGVLDPRITVT
jgi:peptide/nickel transport system permease protein